jgi:hypothetical protein
MAAFAFLEPKENGLATSFSAECVAKALNLIAPAVDGLVGTAAQRFVVPDGGGRSDQVG